MNSRLDDVFFSVICLLALLANILIFHGRATVYAKDDPQMMREANRIVRALLTYIGGLFAILIIGVGLGLASPIRSFGSAPLRPFDDVYLVLNVVVFARGTWWVFAQGGAGILAEHNQMFRYFPRTAIGVKVFWMIMISLLIGGMLSRVSGSPGNRPC